MKGTGALMTAPKVARDTCVFLLLARDGPQHSIKNANRLAERPYSADRWLRQPVAQTLETKQAAGDVRLRLSHLCIEYVSLSGRFNRVA